MIKQLLTTIGGALLLSCVFTAIAWYGIGQQASDTIEMINDSHPPIFGKSATEYLRVVYSIGREVGHPETLQAILLQETRGGQSSPVGNKQSPVGKRSYGLMQVQVVAARSILTRFQNVYNKYFPDRTYKSITDEEIIALLLTNDEANIRIAAYHFKLYHKLAGGNWDKAVAAYNMGIGNANKRVDHSSNEYVVSIRDHIQTTVRQFNKANGLLNS